MAAFGLEPSGDDGGAPATPDLGAFFISRIGKHIAKNINFCYFNQIHYFRLAPNRNIT